MNQIAKKLIQLQKRDRVLNESSKLAASRPPTRQTAPLVDAQSCAYHMLGEQRHYSNAGNRRNQTETDTQRIDELSAFMLRLIRLILNQM